MNHLIVMFDNAGIRYCYDKMNNHYFVCNKDGKEEIRCRNALQAWVYYIQRVDSAVQRRIKAAAQRQQFQNQADKAEQLGLVLSEQDILGS